MTRNLTTGIGGVIRSKMVAFTEDATTTTHTGTLTIPAGSVLLDVVVWSTALWTDSSAAIIVGDANDDDGWFTTTQLDTTDLPVGERLTARSGDNWGGVNGAYLTTAGKFGPNASDAGTPTDGYSGYYASAGSVIGKITVSSPSGTAGRTFMQILYVEPVVVAPVLTV